MTVRVTRTFDVTLPIQQVWNLLSDPENRAQAISVVERYELESDGGGEATWYLSLPIPALDSTLAVRTRDLERNPPKYVKFEGRSRVMNVIGEHELTETADGTRIENRFVVESRVPGLERFFKRNLDAELQNIKDMVERHVEDATVE